MNLEQRFTELWEKVGGNLNAEESFNDLLKRYSEPHRFYHNMNHIQKCLKEFDSAKYLMNNPDIVEMAIWYHDIIYNPKSKDNEEKSADFAYSLCISSGLSQDFSEKLKNLILITKHKILPQEENAKFLVDIDLSSLGASTKEVDENEKNIRKEYYFSSEEVYKNGRRSILQGFLNRERIYLTDFFRNKYEVSARKNITDSLDNLIN